MHEVTIASTAPEGHGPVGDRDEVGAAASSGCGGHCVCGENDDAAYLSSCPRAIPHAIRHSTILGVLGAVPPGGRLVLVAPHDPLLLVAQIERREASAFAVEYLERGSRSVAAHPGANRCLICASRLASRSTWAKVEGVTLAGAAGR